MDPGPLDPKTSNTLAYSDTDPANPNTDACHKHSSTELSSQSTFQSRVQGSIKSQSQYNKIWCQGDQDELKFDQFEESAWKAWSNFFSAIIAFS